MRTLFLIAVLLVAFAGCGVGYENVDTANQYYGDSR